MSTGDPQRAQQASACRADHALLDLLQGGDVRAMSRILTWIEAEDPRLDGMLDAIYARAGRAHVVGLTGVPGAGKSSLVARLTEQFRRSGRRVGVIAVDPSSSLTGGAILGDRIRMASLTQDRGVYIRSMATRGALGGLARSTADAVDVLDAAGFDVVMVETVGVGQDEFEIAEVAQTTVVVSAPGLGDDIQAIKAGILEMADIHVVNKADRPEARKTIADIEAVLSIAGSRRRPGVRVPVLAASAQTGEGIAELAHAIAAHREELRHGDEEARRHAARCERRVSRAMEELALRQVRAGMKGREALSLLDGVRARTIGPRAAARNLIGRIGSPRHVPDIASDSVDDRRHG